MLHTPLHRALGENPGPLTDQMIDDAVASGTEEGDELDWKKALPSEKEFRDSDIVKDIAAFANAAGGVIIFGLTETGRAADGRTDAGELTESYERTIRKVCMAAITPPRLRRSGHRHTVDNRHTGCRARDPRELGRSAPDLPP